MIRRAVKASVSRILIVLFFQLSVAKAQDIAFSPIEGKQSFLNEGHIRNITQLPDGKLAVTTEGMVNLFDGADFKNIRIHDEHTVQLTTYKGFHHSYIEHERLWIKNGAKLSLISLRDEKSESNPHQVLRQLHLPESPGDFFVDTKQDIWVLTSRGKLICRDNRLGKTRVFLNTITWQNASADDLYDLIRKDDRVYLFYRSGLMRCFNWQSGKELYREKFLNDNAAKLGRTLYVVPVGNYLYQLRNGSGGRLTRFDLKTRSSSVLLETNYSLNCLAEDKDGNFWISCPAGLWYFKAGELSGKLYPQLILADGRKIVNETSTVFTDKQGGLWVGTLNKGLFYYHPGRFKFKNLQKQFCDLSADNHFRAKCFEEMPGNDLLIGTRNGLYISAGNPGVLNKLRLLIPDIACNSFLSDKAGNVWIASNKRLFCLKPDGKILPYSSVSVRAMCNGLNGNVYICTSEGLLLLNPTNGTFNKLNSNPRLSLTKQLILWKNKLVGITDKSPFILDLSGKLLDFPLADSPRKYSPMFRHSNHQYSCLLKDKDNLLWFGTFDGLNVWDEKSKKLYQLSTEEGLINNSIKGLTEFKDGTVWVTTARGISRIHKFVEEGEFRFRFTNYTQDDGLIEHSFEERAIFSSPANGLLAAGVEGLNWLSSEESPSSQANLFPVLLDFKLFGKQIKQGQEYDGRIILPHSLSALKSVNLNYDQNFFSISFSGLNYISPAQTTYGYMLEGLDKHWQIKKSSAGIGEAFYTNLEPGTYLFKLKASADGLQWNNAPVVLQVVINPPFWKTVYARLIYVAAMLVLLGSLFRFYTVRNKRRRKKQQEIAVEKAKSEFLTNLSHDLRTPLSLIVSPLKSLLARVNDCDVKDELLRINSSAHILLDTVNQLLEFKRLDADSETLNLSYCEDLSFISDICLGYNALANEKQIVFNIEICGVTSGTWLDRHKTSRIINNLLSNAFKFTRQNDRISLNIEYDELASILTIGVKDSGIGIPAEEIPRIFDRFYQASNQTSGNGGSGIGLSIVKQYAEIHGGSVKVYSATGEGTSFEVLLSVKKSIPDRASSKTDQTILIVEDNTAFRNYLVRELATSYIVIEAIDGSSGLEAAAAHSPDLILTDMMMPTMSGVEFCQAIRNNIAISHIPVIILTARASDEAEFESYESGADAYLTKPVDPDLLRLRIMKLLQLAQLKRQSFSGGIKVDTATITSNPLDQQFLDKAFDCVKKNLSDAGYSVEKFSEDMCMDRSGLYRKLMALTGSSPTNFIKSIRLKRAAELLGERRLNVSQVAEDVGFNSLSYFSKCFHEEFGKTPGQYAVAEGSSNKL